jgi:hypothetical protein
MAVAPLAWLTPINAYDGAISASSATMTLHGLVPYRDYWLLYGPLSGFLLAPPTAVFGPSILLIRLAGLGAIGLTALCAYLIAARTTVPFAATLIALCAALLAPSVMGLELTAWSFAMALSLVALYLRLDDRSPVLVGVLVGLVFLTRLDMGGYLLLACLILPRRHGLLGGFALIAIPFGLAVLATTPLPSVVQQLIWYPIVGPRQFRGIPGMGALISPTEAALLTIPLVLVARGAILAAIVRVVTVRLPRSGVALLVFALACQLQTIGRGDAQHLALASAPAFLLFSFWIGPSVAARRVLAVVAAVCLGIATFEFVGNSLPNAAYDSAVSRSVGVVDVVTDRDQPIFVGLTSNRFTFDNPLLVYYLADRAAGTSVTMYNPGVTNTDAMQAVMVGQLDRSGTDVLVLDDLWADHFEPQNDSRIPGSTILDAYISTNFRVLCDFGDLWVEVRTGATGIPARCPVAEGPAR